MGKGGSLERQWKERTWNLKEERIREDIASEEGSTQESTEALGSGPKQKNGGSQEARRK